MPTMLARAAISGLLVLLFSACGGGASPEDELRRAVLDFNGHVIVMKGSTDFAEYREVIRRARAHDGVVGAEAFTFVEATIRANGKEQVIGVKGTAVDETPVGKRITPPGVLAGYVPPSTGKSPSPPAPSPAAAAAMDPAPDDFPSDSVEPGDVPSHAEPIDFTANAPDPDARAAPSFSAPIHAVIGVALARDLGVAVGDIVELEMEPPMDPATWRPVQDTPVRHRLRIVGTIAIMEYEQRIVLTTLDAVQAMLGRGDQVMGIEIRITDAHAAGRLARALGDELGPPYTVMDWCELNRAALRCKL